MILTGFTRHSHSTKKMDSFSVGEDAGIALGNLWIPEWLSEALVGERIRQILEGAREKLDLSLSEGTTIQVLHKEYHARKLEEDQKN